MCRWEPIRSPPSPWNCEWFSLGYIQAYSQTLDLRQKSEGVAGFEPSTIEKDCKGSFLESYALTSRPPLQSYKYNSFSFRKTPLELKNTNSYKEICPSHSTRKDTNHTLKTILHTILQKDTNHINISSRRNSQSSAPRGFQELHR